jgi:hypothetical protein
MNQRARMFGKGHTLNLIMRQAQNEKRIRELWRKLPEEHRQGIIDVIVFKDDTVRNRPDLLDGIEGDLTAYFKTVLSGLYKTNG